VTELILDSLRRRMRAMHSLWEEAVATMDLDQVNHVEREPVLPIAFSLFHFVQIEDGSATLLGAGPLVYDEGWASRMGLAIADHGKHRTVDEMVHQRIGDHDAFTAYMGAVFAKTEGWLAALVAGAAGITRLDAAECWIYQHGLRHLGEIEHARALVGLQGMTS
jgi:hypothetical protein